jgi:Flavin-binding monooxygenase-like
MPERTDVAVIGAGPAGLAVGAGLRKAGVFIILERGDKVAWSWHRHYERLHLHTVKQLSSLPCLPFPADYPRYVPRNLVIAYLDRYATNFDLKPRFGETVRSVRRDRNDWFIEATQSSISASYVVVASGFNAEAVMPSFPGLGKFRGKVIHSAQYINAKPFVGQSVLVIGMGNSGAEIALDLSEGGARTTISVRNGVHIVPRDLFGIPIQIVAIMATKLLASAANERLFPRILDLAIGDLSKHGIKRNEGILQRVVGSARIPVIDVGTVRKISERAIKVAPGISTIASDGASFSGGNSRKFDAVIFATGYRANYRSFLGDSDVSNPGDHKSAERSSNSTIYFVGFNNSVAGLLRQISREAVEVAGDSVRQRSKLVRLAHVSPTRS